jgi:branched-chain amino acid transport system substrate-binding protein
MGLPFPGDGGIPVKIRHVAVSLTALVAAVAGTVVVTTSSAGAASSGAPVNIAWLGFETGVYAQPTRHNDIELAIKQINAKGGVDGHMFEYTPYDTGFGPATAVTGTQQALASHPTAIIGYSVDDQVQAAAPLLRSSGIPVLTFASGPAAVSTVNHLPNLFEAEVDGPVSGVTADMQYAVKAYHPKSVGIFHTDDTASNADGAQAALVLKKLGVKNITSETASDTATDATTQAVALKSDDLIFQDGFPTVLAVFDNELRQNGYNGPIADGQSGDFLSAFGLVKSNVLDNYFYFPACAPDVLKTPQAEAYTAAYKAAYPGDSLRTAAPYAYDSTMFLAAAIKKDGGSLDPSKLVKTMDTMTYQGVCGPYHADVDHGLLHQVTIVSLKNGPADPILLHTYQEPPLTKAQLKQYGAA